MSDEHVDLETLADLDEGLLDDAQAAAVRTHTAECDECRERSGTLRATRALLSALPAPSMPSEVATRIDAALDAEPAPPTVVPTTVVPITRRRAWWRHPNIAAAAAVVAALGLGSAIVFGGVGKGSNPKRAADTAAGAFAPSGAAPKQWASGTNYTRTTVAALVPHLLLGNPPSPLSPATPETTSVLPSPAPSGVAGVAPGVSFDQRALRDPIALAACATILNVGPTTPLAVDYAEYEGRAATILVIPDHNHPQQFVDVWVIRSVCSASAVDIPFYEVPRPR